MKIEYYRFRHIGFRKILGYICFAIVTGGIGSMVRGVGSTDTIYSRIDAPSWLYVLTIIVVLVTMIIGLNLIFSPIKPVGIIEISENKILISSNLDSEEYGIESVQNVLLKYDPRYKRAEPDKMNHILEISIINKKITLDIPLSVIQKKKLDSLIQEINS